MKKCLVMLLTAALFVVAGCKKDDNNAKKMTFTSDFGGGAKTEINDHAMRWTTGDDIIINGETFACAVKDEGCRAEFTGKVVESPYNAYYPTGIWNNGTLTLPATQYYGGSNLSRVSPMYANSETTSLDFHNICALVKLNLKGTGTVKTITASADQSLCGEFTIQGNETEGYYAAITPTRDGAATVTLNCGDGVALTADAKAFYIALPQGEYNNLKFMVSNGTVTKEVTIAETNLVAGTLYAEEKEVELDAPVIPDGALSGKFTVNSSGKQIYFSKGDLWCDNTGSSPVWHFENNQYDFHTINKNENVQDGKASKNINDTYGQFFWSTNDGNWGITNNHTAGEFKDWGIAYCESNGISSTTTWRTLSGGTNSEWDYLINTRSASTINGQDNCRFALIYLAITVNGVNLTGLLLLPDDFKWPNGVAFPHVGFNSVSVASHVYSVEDFGKLESAGAVFLPCAGHRGNTTYTGKRGRYQSKTPGVNSTNSINFFFYSGKIRPDNDETRTTGCSVRLVHDAN